jgi:phospholipid transport system substrate-binding protein
MIRRHMMGALVACLVALPAAAAWAGIPTDQLRGAIDRVVKTLDNPTLKGDGKVVERRAAVRKIANDIFDFGEIARRSLGRHWPGRTDAEHEEFVGLFADLLERSYISKIDTYGGEKIAYTGERTEGDISVVSTKIISKSGTEVPIDYRLLKKGDRWLVYDVSIEGVSLVSNYRTQFNKIIQTSSYAELIKKMKSKQQQGDVSLDDKPGDKPAAKPKTQ